mmetsp:Transcript_2164/g.6077  ORF Transcript_2164/g.6077 Transcript_2164/m.6077 type:complete len:227 (+) Transcript_2164:221-901(+)
MGPSRGRQTGTRPRLHARRGAPTWPRSTARPRTTTPSSHVATRGPFIRAAGLGARTVTSGTAGGYGSTIPHGTGTSGSTTAGATGSPTTTFAPTIGIVPTGTLQIVTRWRYLARCRSRDTGLTRSALTGKSTYASLRPRGFSLLTIPCQLKARRMTLRQGVSLRRSCRMPLKPQDHQSLYRPRSHRPPLRSQHPHTTQQQHSRNCHQHPCRLHCYHQHRHPHHRRH